MVQADTQSIIDRHDRFMSLNYARFPIAMVQGEGCRLRDADGKEYIDLFAGFGATILGHCHRDLVAALTEQAGRLWHVGNLLHTEAQTRAAEAIAKHGFDGRSFFCHSGADANEAAIKLARLYGQTNPGPRGQRFKVISTTRSFHGRTFGTMPATGEPAVRSGFGPMVPGFNTVPYNDGMAVEGQVDEQTVAVLVEPIQGEGGVIVPDESYFRKLREVCDAHDLLLICDEVWTGGGRTGRYFGYQHWGVEPDIMTLGKGVGGGMAVGVMCAKQDVAALYDARKQGSVKHASTLGGNCLGMAVAATIFDVLERDGLVAQADQLGAIAMQRLRTMAPTCPAIRNVRGRGLFIAIELDLPSSPYKQIHEIVDRCLQRGVLVNGTQQTVLRLAPPLVIDEQTLEDGLHVLQEVLRG
ncbi:MAG: acetylornithine transaminase [Pirellulaceae bacterium]|nr:acetylornithine transaminase [Pirellulaceae bacterium]